MSTLPKVTIGIPSYNHARFLQAAIESVLAQTYPNVEIVIVDDGSTDESLKIAESYATRYPSRVSVFTHPGHQNLGISATVNECFNRSTGAYFSGLPSDDMLLPEKIEEQTAFLDSHPEIGWVYGYAQTVDERGDYLPELYGWDISHKPSPIEELIVSNPIPGMTVLARRECFDRVGPHTEGLIYSDWEFWIRMAACFKFAFIEKPLVKWRIHSHNSGMGIEDQEDIRRRFEVLTSLRGHFSVSAGELVNLKTQALIELQRACLLFHLGETTDSTRSVTSVFEIYPSIGEDADAFFQWLMILYPQSDHSLEFQRSVLKQLPSSLDGFRKKLARRIEGLTFARAALDSYQAGNFRETRQYGFRAQVTDPHWLYNRQLVSALTETVVGTPVMNRARQFKRWFSGQQH